MIDPASPIQRSSGEETAGTTPTIQATGIWRTYQVGSQEVHALRGVDLSIQGGQFVAMRGRSGSGKTTLINMLGGLDEPTSGEIVIAGQALHKMNDAQRTAWRSRQVGLVFQGFGLLPTLSAYENVELALRLAGGAYTAGEREARTLACLERVGLRKWAHHRPYEMSGGQQQRVAIARAIAHRPRLILADEPTGELDTETTHAILALFRQIVQEEGVTLLITTHDDLVDLYADQVLRLQDGQLVES